MSVAMGKTMCLRMSDARKPMPDRDQTRGMTNAPTMMMGTASRLIPIRSALLRANSTQSANAMKATAVISIRLNTELAVTSEFLHTSGSKNFPTGNHPSLKAKIQIIISANAGVNTVNKVVPVIVAAYSKKPASSPGDGLPQQEPDVE